MEEEINKKTIFGIIFGIGLILILFNDGIWSNFSMSYESTLVFSSIIAVFGGSGLLCEIYKKD